MKKFSRIALMLIMLATAVFAVAACGGSGEIKVDPSDLPQTVYVQGNDLDLSKIMLTVKKGGKSEKIPLNSDGVKVSGFDKNTLGKQTVTVEYEGVTTTFGVEIVARMTTENADYFVGESFDAGRSRVRIVADNGETVITFTDDEALTVEGFDSSTPGDRTVTMHYKNAQVDYSSTAEVHIYSVENNGGKGEFNRPNKIAYRSHESGIDVSGGYITLVGKGGGLTRKVELKPEMISGFDLSKAQVENMSTPLSQKVTATYAGLSFEFDVSITFSDVSLIKLRAQQFSALDWTNGVPQIGEQQGKDALDAVQRLYTMSEDDAKYLENADRLAVARVAAAYGMSRWNSALEPYSFGVSNGVIVPDYENYAAAERDLEALTAEYEAYGAKTAGEDNLFVLAETLSRLVESFGNSVFYASYSFGAYMQVCSGQELYYLTLKLPTMLALYDAVKDIPTFDAELDLDAYEDQISAARKVLSESKFISITDRKFYANVSEWREGDDLFDILYWYYLPLHMMGDELGTNTLNVLQNFCLPGALEDFYVSMYNAAAQYTAMENGEIFDSTLFMMYYLDTLKYQAEALQEGLGRTLYNLYRYDVGMNTLKTGTVGYLYLSNAHLSDDDFEEFWQQYADLMKKYVEGGEYLESEEQNRDIEALFEAFAALTPARQVSFLMSLNTLYPEAPERALDYSEGAYTYFTMFLASYYLNELPAAGGEIFKDLLLAMETYSRRYEETAILNEFITHMSDAESKYGALSAADKAEFDRTIGDLYEEYVKLYHDLRDSRYDALDEEWYKKFGEMAQTLLKAMSAYQSMSDQNQIHVAFLSACERAQDIEEEILAGPEEIVRAYGELTSVNILGVSCSLDYAMSLVRSYYVSFLTGFTLDDGSMLLDSYLDTPMQDFLAALYPIIDGAPTAGDICNATAAFREMTVTQQYLYLRLDAQTNFYVGGIETYLEKLANVTANTKRAVSTLLAFETQYITYSLGTTEKADLDVAFKQLTSDVGVLKEDEKKVFDEYMKDMYEYYSQAYGRLSESDER